MEKRVLTVRQLNSEIRDLLETRYRRVWVEGEVSGLATPASGHLYFSLKEENSLIRCAFFRNRQRRGMAVPENGMQVLVSGQVSFYEPRGDLQLIVTHLEESGVGELQRAFERLKKKLGDEGLFDAERKQPIPTLPMNIGVVTSPSGAVLHDVVVTLQRRFPAARVQVYPCLVQGQDAARSVIKAMDAAEAQARSEVLLIARGGGSLEDLQAFNDEALCRRVAECRIPVISAVGHEVDFTICDFVSDQRAPTPTAAAELVTPDRDALLAGVNAGARRLRRCMDHQLHSRQQLVDYLDARLVHPREILHRRRSTLHAAHRSLGYALRVLLTGRGERVNRLGALVNAHSPRARLKGMQGILDSRRDDLLKTTRFQLGRHAHALERVTQALRLTSPRHTLERGYAIVQDDANQVVTDPARVAAGDPLGVRVAKGRFRVVVK